MARHWVNKNQRKRPWYIVVLYSLAGIGAAIGLISLFEYYNLGGQ